MHLYSNFLRRKLTILPEMFFGQNELLSLNVAPANILDQYIEKALEKGRAKNLFWELWKILRNKIT